MKLALVEAPALLLAVAGTILLSGHPPIAEWQDVALVLAQAAALSASCVLAFYYNDLYDLRIFRRVRGFVPRLLQGFGVTLILLALPNALLPATKIADRAFLSSMLVVMALALFLRALGYGIMRHQAFADRVLIVGSGSLARRLIEEIDARPQLRYRIVGVIDDAPLSHHSEIHYPYLGPPQALIKIIDEVRIDRIIVAVSERRGRIPMAQLLEAGARGIPVEDGSRAFEQITRKIAIETLQPSSLIFTGGFREARIQNALRRLMNLGVAVVWLALTTPLMALIALAIKLDSRGPVLFVHDRIGLHGRQFKLLKFRTMVPSDAPTSEWAQDNETRITRVGKWLRRFRLDELPQFVNILRGDMNLVGPRPHPSSNLALFIERIPYYALRMRVRPGVTGWAQIRYGYANNVEEEIEKMRYDLYYIEHLSLWLDLRILFDTVKIVLFGRGSESVVANPSEVETDSDADRFLPLEAGLADRPWEPLSPARR